MIKNDGKDYHHHTARLNMSRNTCPNVWRSGELFVPLHITYDVLNGETKINT